jgi:O-antigen/teichoic acid export membrane protein
MHLLAHDGAVDHGRFRSRRLVLAIGTSFASKIAAVALQFLAMPLAIRALGSKQFAVYAMLSAAMSWISVAGLGMGPMLVTQIASAAAVGDYRAQRRLFVSALAPTLAALLLGVSAVSALLILRPSTLGWLARYDVPRTTILAVGLLFGGSFCLHVVLSLVESLQTGHQEQHFLNSYAFASNVASTLALLVVVWLWPTLIGIALAVNVFSLLARIVNSVRFLKARPYLRPCWEDFDRPTCRSLVKGGAAYSLQSVGSFLNHQLPLVLVGRVSSAETTATFAVVMSLFLSVFSAVSMIGSSLWPAIADSVTRADYEWPRRTYPRFRAAVMLYASAVALAFVVAGPILLRAIYGASVRPSPYLMVWAGVYFLLAAWEYCHIQYLIGFNDISFSSLFFCGRGVAVGLASWLLIPRTDGVGVFVALSASVLAVTCVPYFFRLQGMLRRTSTDHYGL